MSLRLWLSLGFVSAGLGLGACSSDGSTAGPTPDSGSADAGTDAQPDASGSDAAADAASDGALDAPSGELGAPIEIDLGTVTATTPVTLTVPAGTLGFHVVVRKSTAGLVGVESITSPSNELVVNGFTVVGANGPTTAGQSGVGAASVPQSPLASAMPVEPGDWTLVFGGDSTGESLSAKVWLQTTEDGAFHGGVLDLRVYIPSGLMLQDPSPLHTASAATAASDPSISTRVDSFFAALAELYAIGRGEVSFFDIGAEHRTITDYAGLDAALSQTQTPASGPAVHVLLANGVSVFGQEIWGISSGLPGGAVEAGHPASGIALNVSAGFSAIADGWTLLHELGHFAGLFHTSQPDGAGGALFDPLTDTPTCTTLGSSCPDAKNIMFAAFWGASGGSGILASEQQRAIVRGSVLYRAYLGGPISEQASAASRTEPERVSARAGVVPCAHSLRARLSRTGAGANLRIE